VGEIGLQLGNGAYNIHYDNGYVENVETALIGGGTPSAGCVFCITYNGNHIANSGNGTAVAQFTGGVTGSMRDMLVFGGIAPTAIAVCTGTSSSGVPTNSVAFSNNESTSGVTATTGCVTSTSAPTGATLSVTGVSSVNVSADATPLTTITAPLVNSGNTLTLYAAGNFSLATGGNINLGGFGSPLSVLAGNSVTLTLLDQTETWLVTGTTPSAGGITGTTALHTSSIASGACQSVTAGSVNSSAAAGATTASKILWTPAASLQTVTGYQVSTSGALSIDAYPTSGYVNFNVCNWTAGPLTPGSLTLNWELHP